MPEFKHPLARDAKVWTTNGMTAAGVRVLVVITTLDLDPTSKSYKPRLVERLSEGAELWVRDCATDVDDFMLISRPKNWN